MKIFTIFQASLLCAGVVAALAMGVRAEPTADEHDPYAICASRENPTDGEWVDQTHEHLSLNICRAAIWFDRFFGDEQAVEVDADRYIRIIGETDWAETEGHSPSIRVRARFDLPHLRQFGQRLSLVFSDEEETQVTNIMREENQEDPTLSPGDIRRRAMGVRWVTNSTPHSSLSFSSSIRIKAPFKPSIQGRYRYTHTFAPNALARITQTLFWQWDDGFGERSRLDLERMIAPNTLLRWTTSAMLAQESQGLEWLSGVSLYHTLVRASSLSVDATVNGYTEGDGGVDDYRLGFRYRQNIFRKWLFFEIEPYVHWPQATEHNSTLGIAARVEVLLGRKRLTAEEGGL